MINKNNDQNIKSLSEHLFSFGIETRMQIKGFASSTQVFLLPVNTKELVSLF